MIVCLPSRMNRLFTVLGAAIVLSFPGCSAAPVTAQIRAPQVDELRSLAAPRTGSVTAAVNRQPLKSVHDLASLPGATRGMTALDVFRGGVRLLPVIPQAGAVDAMAGTNPIILGSRR
jgi:hypothetical protein